MNKNHFRYIPLFTLLAALTACESSDMPIQHADSYGYITFSASTERTTTRTNSYEDYDATKHPEKMGVFGYHDIGSYTALAPTRAASTPKENPIFDNEEINYNITSELWETTQEKKWDDYLGATNFDFFAYMPKVDGAKIVRETTTEGSTSSASNTYTLSFPFSMELADSDADAEAGTSATQPSPVIFDIKKAPIICATPEHKEGTDAEGKEFTFDREVKLKFDQTLTGYQLLFKLDTKMGAIRQFRLKKVTLSGELATSCTIARSYTYDTSSKSWTAGNIEWNEIQRTSFNAASIGTGNNILLDNSKTDYTQWGSTFYTIPDSKFNPTISVTYDVEFVAQDGSTVVTRKDVTSNIVLNKANFDEFTTQTAMINPIRILIQPRYLYVLSDDDAYTGHLLVE